MMELPFSKSEQSQIHHFSEVIRSHFNDYDTDRNGSISKTELQSYVAAHNDQSEASVCARKMLAEFDPLTQMAGHDSKKHALTLDSCRDDEICTVDIKKLDSFSSPDTYEREHRNEVLLEAALGALSGAAFVARFGDKLPGKYRGLAMGVGVLGGALLGYGVKELGEEKQSYQCVTALACSGYFDLQPKLVPTYKNQSEGTSYLASYFLDRERKRDLENAT